MNRNIDLFVAAAMGLCLGRLWRVYETTVGQQLSFGAGYDQALMDSFGEDEDQIIDETFKALGPGSDEGLQTESWQQTIKDIFGEDM